VIACGNICILDVHCRNIFIVQRRGLYVSVIPTECAKEHQVRNGLEYFCVMRGK
jgi:hypothetical protein